MATKTITRYRYRSKAKAHRSRSQMTLPLAALAGFLPLAGVVVTSFQQGGVQLVGNNLVSNLTGYDVGTHTWNAKYMEKGLMPIVAGLIAHKVVGQYLGVNRMLGRAKVPFIRI
jgi:hypothetical protein